MNVSNIIVSENSLRVDVKCTLNSQSITTYITDPACIVHFCEIQLKVLISSVEKKWYLLLKFKKCVDDGIKYISKVNIAELGIESILISDDCEWRVLGDYSFGAYNFIIKIIISYETLSSLKCLVNDDILTDFKMQGTDGSIRVHKVVLAAASDVFRKMLTLNFKEKNQAEVEVPYPMRVLQDLKEYLYLNTLNEGNLKSLLLLAHCYMMHELKLKCINTLIINITTEKSLQLIEFAVKSQISELLTATLKIVQEKQVNFENYKIILPICDEEGEIEIKQ